MSEPAALTYSLLHRVPLRHEGDVALLAADGDDVWAEEMYSGQWLAQYHVAIGRGILACADEDEGRAADLRPLNIPPDAAAPKRAWAAMGLNVAGARQHGLREDDRLADVLHPLSVADKFALADWLHVSPPALLGLAERYVLAECPLAAPDDLLLCCRLRVAVAVTRQIGVDGLPFDYVTHEVGILQRWHVGDDAPPPEDALGGLPGVPLHRPMDLQRQGDRLIVAEGGAPGRPSAVCALQVGGLPPPTGRDALLLRRLYG